MDLHHVSVRHSSFVTWKRFSMYSRLIMSGFVNGNHKFRDAKIPTRSWGETAGHAAFNIEEIRISFMMVDRQEELFSR